MIGQLPGNLWVTKTSEASSKSFRPASVESFPARFRFEVRLMLIKRIVPFVIASGFILAVAAHSVAQDATSQPATAQASPDPQQQQEEKAKLERKANALLEQVIAEAQSLKLPENRIRVQIAAADMLWDKNPVRARGLFVEAGAVLAQMNVDVDRTDRNEMQSAIQLWAEVVLREGRSDAGVG